MRPALWCKTGLGDRPLVSCLPTIPQGSLHRFQCTGNWEHQRLRSAAEGALCFPGGLQVKMGVGGTIPPHCLGDRAVHTATLSSWHPPGSQEKSCPRGGPGLEALKEPCPRVFWKPGQSQHQATL